MWAKKKRIKPKSNIATTQPWKSEDSQRSVTKCKVLLKYMKLYCQHSSINSFKYLIDPKKTWIER